MKTAPNLRYLLGIITTRAGDLGKALDGLPASMELVRDGVATMSAQERQQTVEYLTQLSSSLYNIRENVLWLKRRMQEYEAGVDGAEHE